MPVSITQKYNKLLVLLCIIASMLIALPANAVTMTAKVGGGDLGSGTVTSISGFLVGGEYLFNSNMGVSGNFESLSASANNVTSNNSLISLYFTLHSDIQSQDSSFKYLNDFFNIYYQVGYSYMMSSATAGGVTSATVSSGGMGYGIGFNILPKSQYGAFIGYRGVSISGGSVGGIIAGIEARF